MPRSETLYQPKDKKNAMHIIVHGILPWWQNPFQKHGFIFLVLTADFLEEFHKVLALFLCVGNCSAWVLVKLACKKVRMIVAPFYAV